MAIRKTIRFFASSLILLHLPQISLAQTANPAPVAELDRLINARQFEQAYQLAIGSLEDWEGETDFDLLYGLAALESGRPNEAVFALERVASTASQSTTRRRARLELARAHFMSNNLIASEALFREVLETDPPPNVRQNVLVFLELIETRQQEQTRNTRFTVASNVGYDSNVNSSTASSIIDTPLIGGIELDPTGRKTSDEFADVNATISHHEPFTRNRSLDANLSYNKRENFSTSAFDLDTLRANAIVTQTRGNHRYRLGVQVQRAWLDGTGFQQGTSSNVSWQRAGANGWYQTVAGSLSAIRYDNTGAAPRNNLRNVNQAMVSGGLIHINNSITNSINIFYANEDPRYAAGKHNGREFYGIAHNLQWRVNNQHSAYARVSLQDVTHKDRHPVFFDRSRNDTIASLTAGWQWQYNRQLRLSSEFMYMNADSNIVLFDYSRTRLQVGLQYQFQR